MLIVKTKAKRRIEERGQSHEQVFGRRGNKMVLISNQENAQKSIPHHQIGTNCSLKIPGLGEDGEQWELSQIAGGWGGIN